MIYSNYSLLSNLTIVVADEVTTGTDVIECTVLEVQDVHITLTRVEEVTTVTLNLVDIAVIECYLTNLGNEAY